MLCSHNNDMMKILYLMFLLVSANSYDIDYPEPEELIFEDDGDYHGSKSFIVGGKEIDISEEPYLAQLIEHNIQVCGATIISKDWLLTAAHCVNDPSNYSIMTGSTYQGKGGEGHKIDKIIIHEKYDNVTDENDIALIKLTKPMTFSNVQDSISIAIKQPVTGDLVKVTGFGKEGDDKPYSLVLKSAIVEVVDQGYCEITNKPDPITRDMFCASTTPADTCQGDSGGPAVIDDKLAGVVSFGYNCGSDENPAVYTRVPNYRKWIRDNSGLIRL